MTAVINMRVLRHEGDLVDKYHVWDVSSVWMRAVILQYHTSTAIAQLVLNMYMTTN